MTPPRLVELPTGFIASRSPDGRITFIWEEEFVPSPKAKLGNSITWKEIDDSKWQVVTYRAASRKALGELLFTAILHNRRAVVVVVNTGEEIITEQSVALGLTLGQDLRNHHSRRFAIDLFNQYQGERAVATPTSKTMDRRAPAAQREEDNPTYQHPAYQLSSPSGLPL